MKFPHAYAAVKKLFLAELISIAVAVLSLTAAILAAVGIENESALLTAGTLGLVSLIAMIVVFVFQLVALIQGKKESEHFGIALWLTLIAIIVSVVSTVLQSIDATKGLGTLFSVLDAVVNVANVLVILMILFGISNIADKLGNKEMSEKGSRLATYIVILYVVSIGLSLVAGIFNKDGIGQGWAIAFAIFGIVAAIIVILIYVNVVIYYYRAIKMLKK